MKEKMIRNAKWIMLCKGAQALLQLVVGLLCARYLGPSNYGLLSYAKSAVAFALPVMQLGLDETLVREQTERKTRQGEVLGTALLLRLLSGAACAGMVCAFVAVRNPREPVTLAVTALYSLSLLFRAGEVIGLWFQSGLRSKIPEAIALGAYGLISAFRIFLLHAGKSVLWFALAGALEFGLVSALLLIAYKSCCSQRLRFSWNAAKQLLGRSCYYVLATLPVVAFQNLDHLMLKAMAGQQETGLYAAAITCTVVVQFVYLAIMDSARPVILERKGRNKKAYEEGISRLYGIIFHLAAAQGIAFFLLAKPMLRLLYGDAFLAAVPVLRILAFQPPLSYLGTVRNIWILAEEKHRHLPVINLLGLGANGILNALLIPRWGACGAAAATVVTQFFTNVLVGFLLPDIRPNNRLLLAGLRPEQVWDTLRSLKNNVNNLKQKEDIT